MATVAKFQTIPPDSHRRTTQQPPPQLGSRQRSILFHPPPVSRHGLRLQPCMSFKTDNDVDDDEKSNNKLFGAFKSLIFSKDNSIEKLEEILSRVALHLGRYIVTMMSTGVVLAVGFNLSGGDGQLNDLIWYSWVGGIIIGTMIGSNMVLDEVSRAGPRNVVITGSTRGLGKALAREFLLSGDRVVIASRSKESVDMTINELEENLQECLATTMSSSMKKLSYAKVVGTSCDVCDPDDVRKLANYAVDKLGSVDIWINNAGTNKGFRPLLQFSDKDIEQIVSTNLVGSILCTREAMRIMGNQHRGGHIFNMDGAGSGGSSTPLTAVYGSTKCGLRQLQSSLFKECKKSKVGVHTASPGMVLTDLLLSGSSIQNKQMFNIICELPETVARTLVPRMRVVKGSGKAINYLTPPRILLALVTAWLRRKRWFDEKGRALYAAEADRIRNWAESRTRFSFTDAIEMYTENTWVSVFSLSVVCAFIILSSTAGGASHAHPGT
ncbi:putative chlorophyll(ide) b reductase [Helianthus annuus]|uniref:chlorophyll(ide) b reductase n=1 Tax=Helianthus annuus TaxID=4232 RepID=A0A251UIL8_HELAN|nr:probable chlorophyll(ide) b reductase NYC1, chloroplastic [Helianthus annuus]KAF5802829.1 putative chlorophyll(ide) b reductase [Helianthus annuus]KAJ0560904.1 putative chlorophyll(ide) b reductase [Helianthus annuus]KAJ0567375.1 putative chlorophyll(ide) b reductase [Helianthus annuus]KAJ0573943.1 putative chlorophyll(ide) b reductase [Helianthus annuus]KAJ0738277.1 putative chlorophyll(ide) b reductase [Helianthus annuus]